MTSNLCWGTLIRLQILHRAAAGPFLVSPSTRVGDPFFAVMRAQWRVPDGGTGALR